MGPHSLYYCIAGKFGGELNLAVNSAKMFVIHRHLWNAVDKLPNLNSTNCII